MKKVILVAVAVLGILALFAVGASATDVELVVNGDFETPVVAATQGWDIYDSGYPGLEWTVEWRSDVPPTWGSWTRPDPAHLELHRGVMGWLSYGGSQQHTELDTDWNGPVASGPNNEPASVRIYQDLATCPGETYTVTYAWSPRPDHGDNKLQVKWAGTQIGYHTGSGASNTNWSLPSSTQTASSEWTRLEFVELGTNDSLGMFLDAVSVTGPTHPCVIEVVIDIKPTSDPNCINLGSKGVIPVAILSSATFDATQVDPTSVSLAGSSVAVRGKGKSLAHEEDVNGDGLLDLVVQVETDNLDPNAFQDGTVCLTGTTYGGEAIQGCDEICIVPPE